MVMPRLRSLEKVEKAVAQVGAARSGMFGRGRVTSVDLVNVTAVVERYGRLGQTARLENVGIIGFPEASETVKLRGEDVMLLFPSGKAGAGEAWILGVVSRPATLYDSLVADVGGSVEIVDHQRVIERRRDTVAIVSDVDSVNSRRVTIAGVEIAADSVENATMRVTIGGAVYQSFTIGSDARRVASGLSIGSEAPLTVLAPVGTSYQATIPAGASLDLTLTISAVRSAGVDSGSYRVFTGEGAAGDAVFSLDDPAKEYPLIRIRGQVTTL